MNALHQQATLYGDVQVAAEKHIKDAFYAARDQGRTMHQAAEDAAELLARTGLLATREHDAKVWDEGFNEGWGYDPGPEAKANPYEVIE